MKNKNRFIALIILTVLTFSNVMAAGFPEEPMIIYGNITGENLNGKTLNIFDGDNNLKSTVQINNNKYGTDKTFDINSKVLLNTFNGELIFQIDSYISTLITLGKTGLCNTKAIFQKGSICEYNLFFKEKSISTDNIIIPSSDKTSNIQEVFKGKIKEAIKTEIVKDIGENILSNMNTNSNIIVTSSKLEVIKNIVKNIVILSSNKLEAIYIPENTSISETNVIIKQPIKIINKDTIKNKINKEIVGAIEVPTNKKVTFNKQIRICTKVTQNSTSGLTIYSSNDNINWSKDTNASGLQISNGQACFNVNHLTSFAIAKEVPQIVNRGSSGGGSGYRFSNLKKIQKKTIEQNKKLKEKESLKIIVKRNKDGKIVIKGRDYIRNLRMFIDNKKSKINLYGYNVIMIKGDIDYNKNVKNYTKKIYTDIKLPSIRKTMISYLDRMSTTYGIYTDSNLAENMKAIYKAKLKEDKEYFEFKIKKLKRKDEIIRYVLNKRKMQKIR